MKNTLYIIFICSFCLLLSCEHPTIYVDTRVKEFTYSEKNITINKGDTLNSVLPMFISESPVSFTIKTKPESNGKITIDEKGVISVSRSISAGSYAVDVEVSNQGGTSIFTNVYAINVMNLSMPIGFNTDILPLVISKCSGCHTTGSNSYKIYANFKDVIDESIRRVQLASNEDGFMPLKRSNQPLSPLSATEIDVLKKWKSDGFLE